jgi:hypothetical protein
MVAMCLASREPGPSDKAFSRQHAIDAVSVRTTHSISAGGSTNPRQIAAALVFNLGNAGGLSISRRSNTMAMSLPVYGMPAGCGSLVTHNWQAVPHSSESALFPGPFSRA